MQCTAEAVTHLLCHLDKAAVQSRFPSPVTCKKKELAADAVRAILLVVTVSPSVTYVTGLLHQHRALGIGKPLCDSKQRNKAVQLQEVRCVHDASRE